MRFVLNVPLTSGTNVFLNHCSKIEDVIQAFLLLLYRTGLLQKFLKARGLADLPMTINLSLWRPVAFVQGKNVTLSLEVLRPGADASLALTSVLSGKSRKNRPDSSAL